MKFRITLLAGLVILGAILVFGRNVSRPTVDVRAPELGIAGSARSKAEQELRSPEAIGSTSADEDLAGHEQSELVPEVGEPESTSNPRISEVPPGSNQLPAAAETAEEISQDETPSEETHWIPRDWYRISRGVALGYRLESDFETVWVGSASAAMGFPGMSATRRFGGIIQVVNAERFSGQRIKFSGYLRTKSLDPNRPLWAALWVRADDESGASVAFQNTQDYFAPSDAAWLEATIIIDIPTTASALNYGAWSAGDGLTWVDGLSLEVVDLTYPLTAPPYDRHNLGRVPNSMLETPSNLSFEDVIPNPDQ